MDSNWSLSSFNFILLFYLLRGPSMNLSTFLIFRDCSNAFVIKFGKVNITVAICYHSVFTCNTCVMAQKCYFKIVPLF